MFSQILDKTGIPLRALDSADTVDATAGTDTSVASYGQYRIMHTFNSSFRAKTPLLEQFLITLRLGDERIKRRTTLLEPPAGYENSSMEPMAVRVPADSRAEVKTEPPQGKSSGSMPVWKWGIVLVLVFVCIVAWIARMCWSRRRDELDSEN